MTTKIVEAVTGSGKTAWAAATPHIDVDGSLDSQSPRDFGLPHDTWRTNQREILQWLTDGCGGKTIALCKTKNLQAVNYGDLYGATILFGRGNYECVHPDNLGTMCDECLFIETSMHKCPHSNFCRYLLAKDKAKFSQFTCLNYAYFLSARWPRESSAEYLYCDEAHQLSEIVLDWTGCTITDSQRIEWELPMFPRIEGQSGSKLLGLPDPMDAAMEWLGSSIDVLKRQYLTAKSRLDAKAMKKCERLGQKLANTLDALDSSGRDWYVRAGRNVLLQGGSQVPGFVAKPLTAQHHFRYYFPMTDRNIIAMSATIGDPEMFAKELGIGQYEFRAVPNQWAPETRRVYTLDAPKMGRKSTEADYEHQADVIAEAILSVPHNWCGIVHVTRKSEATLLAKRLGMRGLSDRVWVIPGANGMYCPTDQQTAAWQARKARVLNSICVAWSLWEGYDGLDERINIVAKVPFPFLGDPYERERLNYSGKFYLQRTAWQLEQALGRTRRGRPEDYDVGEVRGLVAIADGNWVRVRKYLSQSLREALTKELYWIL